MRVEANGRSRCRVTFENETRRKPLAGRDEYGGSNVFWYRSSLQEVSVYAGARLESAARVSESLIGGDGKWHMVGSTSRDDANRHTNASARERTLGSGL